MSNYLIVVQISYKPPTAIWIPLRGWHPLQL